MNAEAQIATTESTGTPGGLRTTHRPSVRKLDARKLHLVSGVAVLEEAGPPRSGLYSAFAILLLIIGAVAWAAATNVANMAVAPGSVMPTGTVVEVQHLEGGIVASVPVRKGDQIAEGDLLIALDPTAYRADLDQLRARYAALTITAERLRAEAFDKKPDFDVFLQTHRALVESQIEILEAGRASLAGEQAVLQARLAERDLEIESDRVLISSLEEQLAVVGEQLRMRQTLLERGLAPRFKVLEVQRDYTQLAGELAQARGGLARAKQAAEEARRSLAELELKYRGKATDEFGAVAAELAEVAETLTRLEDRVVRSEIRSPIDGVVHQLAATTPGQVVEPGKTVATIVPSEGGLLIEAQLSPRDVGYVAVGQSAEINIDGFDVAQFGRLPGTVTFVSPSTVRTPEGESYYRIQVTPDAQQIGGHGKAYDLIAGMAVQVSVHTGDQSILSYLIRPVYRSLTSSFGER